jgi:hypothetical protein
VQSGGISVVEPVELVDAVLELESVSGPVVRPCVVVESSVVDTVVVVSVDVAVVVVLVPVVAVEVGAPDVGSVDGAVLEESMPLVVGRVSVVATASPQAGTISVKQRKLGRNVIFMRRRYHFGAGECAPVALNS